MDKLIAKKGVKKKYKSTDEHQRRKMIGEAVIGATYTAIGAAVINKALKSSKTYSNGARAVNRLLA